MKSLLALAATLTILIATSQLASAQYGCGAPQATYSQPAYTSTVYTPPTYSVAPTFQATMTYSAPVVVDTTPLSTVTVVDCGRPDHPVIGQYSVAPPTYSYSAPNCGAPQYSAPTPTYSAPPSYYAPPRFSNSYGSYYQPNYQAQPISYPQQSYGFSSGGSCPPGGCPPQQVSSYPRYGY